MCVEDYVAERIKQLCDKHKFSKYRLAQLTGMSQTALGNIFAKTSIPTIPTLEKICEAFDISLAQFFAGEGCRPDLTEAQTELLEMWAGLNTEEQRILFTFIHSLYEGREQFK